MRHVHEHLACPVKYLLLLCVLVSFFVHMLLFLMWIYFGLWPRPALALAVSLFFCCLFDYYIVYPGMRQPVKCLLIKTNFKCKRTGCTLSQFQNNTHQPVPFSYVRLFYLYCLFYSYFSCLVRSFVHKSKIIFHYPSYSGT